MASRTFRHLALLVTIVVLLLAVAVVVAQDSTATPEAQSGGTLRVGVSTPPGTLDPALQTDDSEIALNRAIYDYLVEVLPDSTIGPNLASDWKISSDGLTYTFNLVKGVTFQ